MRHRLILSVVLACFCCGLLSGCGGGESVKYPDAQTVTPEQKKEAQKPKPKATDTN